jgi:hypothetical protein
MRWQLYINIGAGFGKDLIGKDFFGKDFFGLSANRRHGSLKFIRKPGNKMRSIIIGAVVAASLAGPAYAQKQPDLTPLQQELETKKKDAAALDKQYLRTLERTSKNAEPVKTDPWQNMRGTGDSKTKK